MKKMNRGKKLLLALVAGGLVGMPIKQFMYAGTCTSSSPQGSNIRLTPLEIVLNNAEIIHVSYYKYTASLPETLLQALNNLIRKIQDPNTFVSLNPYDQATEFRMKFDLLGIFGSHQEALKKAVDNLLQIAKGRPLSPEKFTENDGLRGSFDQIQNLYVECKYIQKTLIGEFNKLRSMIEEYKFMGTSIEVSNLKETRKYINSFDSLNFSDELAQSLFELRKIIQQSIEKIISPEERATEERENLEQKEAERRGQQEQVQNEGIEQIKQHLQQSQREVVEYTRRQQQEYARQQAQREAQQRAQAEQTRRQQEEYARQRAQAEQVRQQQEYAQQLAQARQQAERARQEERQEFIRQQQAPLTQEQQEEEIGRREQARIEALLRQQAESNKTTDLGTLGLGSAATADDIKKAYKQFAKELHPDRNPGNVAAATDKFQEISAAYDRLKILYGIN